MKKTIGLTLIVFAVSFLTSCASNGLVLPKTIPGTIKTYTVNQEGTVEILGQDIKTKPTHWLYVHCDHWSGCYMRCQGEINSCKKVVKDSGLQLDYVVSGR
ncbi:MAG: hypothetical protein HOF64_05305 [Nitrospina sp.]|nr:hypothetical protein [Nitrospina sp.]